MSTTTKGATKYEWIKVHDRNEPLDCRNYARAAAAALGIANWAPEYFTLLRNELSLGFTSLAPELSGVITRKRSSYLE